MGIIGSVIYNGRPMNPAPAALLECRGLAFARNEEPVFGPLDFALVPGEALQVHGGIGRGKTTLLRVLAGLLPATEGEVRFEGRPVDRDHLARGCAFLGHLHGHKGELSTLENLEFATALQGGSGDAMRALAEVGLSGYEGTLARRM